MLSMVRKKTSKTKGNLVKNHEQFVEIGKTIRYLIICQI